MCSVFYTLFKIFIYIAFIQKETKMLGKGFYILNRFGLQFSFCHDRVSKLNVFCWVVINLSNDNLLHIKYVFSAGSNRVVVSNFSSATLVKTCLLTRKYTCHLTRKYTCHLTRRTCQSCRRLVTNLLSDIIRENLYQTCSKFVIILSQLVKILSRSCLSLVKENDVLDKFIFVMHL